MKKLRKLSRKTAFRVFVVCVPVIIAAVFVLTYAVFYNNDLKIAMDNAFGGERIEFVKSDKDYEYYKPAYSGKKEVLSAAEALNLRICGEGTVLLKNDNDSLPLKRGSRVSVFGKNSVDLVCGGSGTSVVNGQKLDSIYDGLGGYLETNPALEKFYRDDKRSGDGRDDSPHAGEILWGMETGETPLDKYSQTLFDSCADYSDAAIVVFSRTAGEGYDLPRSMRKSFGGDAVKGAASGDDHYLRLDKNERDLLKKVCGLFGTVVVIVNSPSAIELGFLYEFPNLKAALWIGATGGNGIAAIGGILTGEVNPSGRLPDTYARDFTKDPAFVNFGNNNIEYGNRYTVNGKRVPYYFCDYEEGIYVGYRYYETRGATEISLGNADWYEKNVVFPFGYGLSYTSFDWEITGSTDNALLSADDVFEVSVKVTNIGEHAGADVVQLYCAPPYFGGIEKPAVVLAAFAKTGVLYPKTQADETHPCEQTLTLKFTPRDIASYDYSDANVNGFRGYELERGEYGVYVSRDAHSWADGSAIALGFTTGDERLDGAVNLFDNASADKRYMTRADFAGSFPDSPTVAEREASEDFISGFAVKVQNSEKTRKAVRTDLKLYDLIGADYSDPRWDELTASLTHEEMRELVGTGGYGTADIKKVFKPKTIDADGPMGFVGSVNSAIYDTCFYASMPVLAATFDAELAADYGRMLGEEALVGNAKGDGRPYNGLYAPSVNIHRSPFGGRNWEYFSEDGFLTGAMAARIVAGARECGLTMYVKHFALNDQETNRSSNGLAVFANEQAMREIYFKPFELCVKRGGATGIMSSFNRIGQTWAGACNALLTDLLRDEWGFCGTVITDYNYSASYMNVDAMLLAGGDLSLSRANYPETGGRALERAAKNILYTTANSNAVNGFGKGVKYSYAPPPWHGLVIGADAFIAGIIIAWGAIIIIKFIRSEEGNDV